jgi:hypothetical protein
LAPNLFVLDPLTLNPLAPDPLNPDPLAPDPFVFVAPAVARLDSDPFDFTWISKCFKDSRISKSS